MAGEPTAARREVSAVRHHYSTHHRAKRKSNFRVYNTSETLKSFSPCTYTGETQISYKHEYKGVPAHARPRAAAAAAAAARSISGDEGLPKRALGTRPVVKKGKRTRSAAARARMRPSLGMSVADMDTHVRAKRRGARRRVPRATRPERPEKAGRIVFWRTRAARRVPGGPHDSAPASVKQQARLVKFAAGTATRTLRLATRRAARMRGLGAMRAALAGCGGLARVRYGPPRSVSRQGAWRSSSARAAACVAARGCRQRCQFGPCVRSPAGRAAARL